MRPYNLIPITILTKSAWWLNYPCKDENYTVESFHIKDMLLKHKELISLGFTLTGEDYMERHCISTTQERIDAMEWAHDNGIYTWASIEPVINYEHALDVIILSLQGVSHRSRLKARHQIRSC